MTGSVLNILIKLIAVVLAIFLWFNVITEKQYEHELTLAVSDVELPATLGAVSAFPDSMKIKVLAEGKKLLRNDWKKAGLRLKAGRLKRGINNLELSLETVTLVRSEDVTLLDLPGATPITVQLDRLDSVLIPVASRLAVLPRDEHMIVAGRGGISPLQTQVIGPGLVLKRIDSIYTEQKILDDVDESVELVLSLEIPEDASVSLAHDSATVEVMVDRIKRKLYENIPVTVGNIRGRRIIVDPDRVLVEIEGPETLIDSLGDKQIQVRVEPPRNMTDSFLTPVVVLPPNFSLVAVTPDSIRVLVSR
jgi:hypothetical protein